MNEQTSASRLRALLSLLAGIGHEVAVLAGVVILLVIAGGL